MVSESPPTIGITCIRIPPDHGRRPVRFGQNHTYVHALERARGTPLLLPQLLDRPLLRAAYERLDGLLLPGGEDIDPGRYGEPVHEQCGRISPGRDEMELTLARWAVADGKPLLAICRGIQVLNVALGGSLYQDIQTEVPGALKHACYPDFPRDHLPHTVAITAASRLAHILGTTALAVNSMHHQAIKDVAPGLTMAGQAPDQIIEAAEVEGHPFAVAVQWHPEELAPEDTQAQRLFDALVKACQE